ncbi:hypothetical protein R3P38DRAFT_2806749 [Favolaschia claudopus]|uniref:Uncharacterized protein n=1 Tax=Favolaschia claudopus TaxID=2862362 RepID=A0AAV9ZJF7_9AGAR
MSKKLKGILTLTCCSAEGNLYSQSDAPLRGARAVTGLARDGDLDVSIGRRESGEREGRGRRMEWGKEREGDGNKSKHTFASVESNPQQRGHMTACRVAQRESTQLFSSRARKESAGFASRRVNSLVQGFQANLMPPEYHEELKTMKIWGLPSQRRLEFLLRSPEKPALPSRQSIELHKTPSFGRMGAGAKPTSTRVKEAPATRVVGTGDLSPSQPACHQPSPESSVLANDESRELLIFRDRGNQNRGLCSTFGFAEQNFLLRRVFNSYEFRKEKTHLWLPTLMLVFHSAEPTPSAHSGKTVNIPRSRAMTPSTLKTSKAHFPQLPPFQGCFPRPVDPLRYELMHQLRMKLPSSPRLPFLRLNCGLRGLCKTPTVDPDRCAEDLVREIALQARWMGYKGSIICSSTSLPIQIHRRTEFLYYHDFNLFNEYCFSSFYAICASNCDHFNTEVTFKLPASVSTSLYSLHWFLTYMRCTFQLSTKSHSIYAFNGTHSIQVRLQNSDFGTVSGILGLTWITTGGLALSRLSCFCTVKVGLDLAQECFVGPITFAQYRNYAGIISEAETLPLRTKFAMYFDLNPEIMPILAQVYRNYADAETMQVRIKLAAYFNFNTETMPVSSQISSSLDDSRESTNRFQVEVKVSLEVNSTLDWTESSTDIQLNSQTASSFNPSESIRSTRVAQLDSVRASGIFDFNSPQRLDDDVGVDGDEEGGGGVARGSRYLAHFRVSRRAKRRDDVVDAGGLAGVVEGRRQRRRWGGGADVEVGKEGREGGEAAEWVGTTMSARWRRSGSPDGTVEAGMYAAAAASRTAASLRWGFGGRVDEVVEARVEVVVKAETGLTG